MPNNNGRQQRVAQHKMPLIRSSGPLRPWPWDRTAQLHRQDHREHPPVHQDTTQPWIDEVLDSLDACCIATAYQLLQHQPYSGQLAHLLMQSLSMFHVRMGLIPTPHHAEKHIVLQEAICLWQSTYHVPEYRLNAHVDFHDARCSLHCVRLPVDSPDPVAPIHARRNQLQQELWQELSVPHQVRKQLDSMAQRRYQWPAVRSPGMVSSPLFLYVYSGRRREGDFQSHVETYLDKFQFPGRVLMLDLALSDNHDITNDDLVAKLLQWFRAGIIAGLLVAPPCETWSEARYQLEENGRAPRPIRTAEFPFGALQLTAAELQQILVASTLLFAALRLLLAAMMTGTPGIMEHPREPKRPERASIWRLHWLQAMFSSRLVQLRLIRQAEYGARSSKPTHLAVCHVPCFWETMSVHTVAVNWSNLTVLKGKQQDGTWRTSEAKEYPSLLNQALAHTLVQAATSRATHQHPQEPHVPDFESDFNGLYCGDVDLAHQQMRPDYSKFTHRDLDQLD